MLVGYFPKRRTPCPDPLRAAGVGEVASVSECIAPGPEGWVDAWRHNDWGLFDSPALAWSVVPGPERSAFDLYAYELRPLRFEGGERTALDPVSSGVAPLDDRFEPLGFDVVSRTGRHFECSPLSCNLWATRVGANAHCLVDDAEEALALASVAEAEGCEPGPYFVLRVWRLRRDA